MLTYTGEHLEKRLLEPLGGQSLSISADNVVATLHFDGVCMCMWWGLVVWVGVAVFFYWGGGSLSIFADNVQYSTLMVCGWAGGGMSGGGRGLGERVFI